MKIRGYWTEPRCFLGVDSSNYRSSAAAFSGFDSVHKKYTSPMLRSYRKLLDVPDGKQGLRQSDAVFAHIKQLPAIIEETLYGVFPKNIKAIGVSDSPRRVEGSYMPCFLAGVSSAKAMSTALKVPLYTFSHQEGHIAAALYSCNRTDLFEKEFIAFHISGGTTEGVLVKPDNYRFKTEVIAKTLDISIGQLIDRTGVMLGLKFPCGEELEKLAEKGKATVKITPCIKGNDCALSGIENIVSGLIKNGETPENTAAVAIEYASKTLNLMAEKILKKHSDLPFIFSGGVMANKKIRDDIQNNISKKTSAFVDFASPELSGDNAVGIAVLTCRAFYKSVIEEVKNEI